MENLTLHIRDCLERKEDFMLATIMVNRGSTPRTSGSRMLVLRDRSVIGTIGGGLVEAKVIDACMALMGSGQGRILDFSLNKELKDGLDMVCGGDLTVLLEDIGHDPGNALVFQAAADLELNGKKGYIVSAVNSGSSRSLFTTQKALVLEDSTISGPLVLPRPLMDAVSENKFSGTAPILFNHGLEEYIICPVPVQDTIFIFGAGHVGYKLAQMAHLTDFQTVVIDDREEFLNRRRFPHAAKRHRVDDFSTSFSGLTIDRHAYIVILTRGHLHDQTVLEAALKTRPAYIGMIGSKSKREQIYRNLMKKGIPAGALDRVFSPIGLKIKSETPAEIAVSIIGEIIHQRADK